MIVGFKEAVERVKYNIEYGFHCNDISFGDFEDDLCFIFDKLAEDNGEPEIDWEYHPQEVDNG
jgi:hypothetical protein